MTSELDVPQWAKELRIRYLSGEASIFLLHGNVRDVVPRWNGDKSEFVTLREYLVSMLKRTKDMVAYYNVSEGFKFPTGADKRSMTNVVNVRSGPVLEVVEHVITSSNQRAGVILDYVEMIAPMGQISYMSETDKASLVSLERWTSDPAVLQSDNLVVLVCENLADVHKRLSGSASLATVKLGLPNEDERRRLIGSVDRTGVVFEMDDDAFVSVTAGLSLVQIMGVLRRAKQSGQSISFRTVSIRKKSIIETECHGLVEFVAPSHGFDHVGGFERLKSDLMGVAELIRTGQRSRVPMGMMFVGPMGTGKTYMAEAFAAESGLTCIKFKNFRDRWVGSTEANLEKVLQVVEGLGYVLLIIDEADRTMASGGDGDGGTSSRVIARLKEFMSDTSHRGRVVVLMMTNRPDKLDADLKRSGRLDMKIPFFFPESTDERSLVLKALASKNMVSLSASVDLSLVASKTNGYSGAELESVLLAASSVAFGDERDVVNNSDLSAAVLDVLPSRDLKMLKFMELLAVFESSSRKMLPKRYRDLSAQEINSHLESARAGLGNRIL